MKTIKYTLVAFLATLFSACSGELPLDGKLETDVSMTLILKNKGNGQFQVIQPVSFNTNFTGAMSLSKGALLSENIKLGKKTIKEIAKMNLTITNKNGKYIVTN